MLSIYAKYWLRNKSFLPLKYRQDKTKSLPVNTKRNFMIPVSNRYNILFSFELQYFGNTSKGTVRLE
jgi:hypothetical protein